MIRRSLAVSISTAFEFRKLYMKHKDLIALPHNLKIPSKSPSQKMTSVMPLTGIFSHVPYLAGINNRSETL